MKVDFAGRQAVNFSFRFGDALKHRDRFLLHPGRKFTARDELFDFGKIATVIVRVIMVVFRFVMMMAMIVRVSVLMLMVMSMFVAVLMIVVMLMFMREVDIKLHASDGGFLSARDVEMIAVELELFQLAFEFAGVHAEVEQRGDEHVASNAAEEVEVKSFHFKKWKHRTFNIERPISNDFAESSIGCSTLNVEC